MGETDTLRDLLDEKNRQALERYRAHPRQQEIEARWLDVPTYHRLALQQRTGLQLTGIPR